MAAVIGTTYGNLAPQIAHANRHGEHTLLYLRFHGIDDAIELNLRRSLERVTSRLWGPATLSRVGKGEYALFLESWSIGRGLQLAALLDRAAAQGFRRLGRNGWLDVGTVAVRQDMAASEVLALGARACGSAETHPPPG